MIAIDTNTNKAYHSKYANRIAKHIGLKKEDTIYEWMKLDIKIKQYKNYLVYLDCQHL